MKITLQALAFQPNRWHQLVQIDIGILFLGHYSSAKMLYAARSLLNALILFFYGILCRRYIQKITKWSQKHNFIEITSQYCPFSAQ